MPFHQALEVAIEDLAIVFGIAPYLKNDEPIEDLIPYLDKSIERRRSTSSGVNESVQSQLTPTSFW